MADGETVPRIIHQIWIGDKPIPDDYLKNTKTLVDHNPGWEYRLWTDSELRTACADVGVLDAYENAPCLHCQIDLGRYALLCLHGGVTVDMDVVSLRPLDSLHDQTGAFTGPMITISECSFNDQLTSWERYAFGFATMVNNAFFAAPSGSDIMRRLCLFCAQLLLLKRRYTRQVQWIDVMFTTGPFAVSRFVAASPGGEFRVLPCRYVEPLMNFMPRSALSSDSVLWHIGSMSWIPAGHKPVVFFAFLHRYAITVFVALLIISCTVVVRRRRQKRSCATMLPATTCKPDTVQNSTTPAKPAGS